MKPRMAPLALVLLVAAAVAASVPARAEQPHEHEHAAHVEHAAHGEHDEKAPPPPINWTHGLFGEKPGVEPNLFWRAPGEPPPYLASLINFAVLIVLVVRFGKKPVAAALTKRKSTILHDIEESQRMRVAAEERLQQYEERLGRINEELERVRHDFREQGERDKERIVREAKERSDCMLDDAQLLLTQEASEQRHALLAELVDDATRKAAEMLTRQMTLGDHDRFAENMLADVRARSAARTPGSFGPPRGGVS